MVGCGHDSPAHLPVSCLCLVLHRLPRVGATIPARPGPGKGARPYLRYSAGSYPVSGLPLGCVRPLAPMPACQLVPCSKAMPSSHRSTFPPEGVNLLHVQKACQADHLPCVPEGTARGEVPDRPLKYITLVKYTERHFGSKIKVARKSHVKKDDLQVESFKKTSVRNAKK